MNALSAGHRTNDRTGKGERTLWYVRILTRLSKELKAFHQQREWQLQQQVMNIHLKQ